MQTCIRLGEELGKVLNKSKEKGMKKTCPLIHLIKSSKQRKTLYELKNTLDKKEGKR